MWLIIRRSVLISVLPAGTPINKPPVLGYKDLNLFKLFRLVYRLGGCHKVTTVSPGSCDLVMLLLGSCDVTCCCLLQIESGTVWKQVYVDLGIPVLNSAASYNVKTAYKK